MCKLSATESHRNKLTRNRKINVYDTFLHHYVGLLSKQIARKGGGFSMQNKTWYDIGQSCQEKIL